MVKDEVINEYFNWLYNIVCADRYSNDLSYRKLLMRLHSREFVYVIDDDRNRAADGIDLRHRFAQERNNTQLVYCLSGPCSILEMMAALALRCEETIMDDPKFGNRTSQWFWGMITNLGLGHMNDKRFNKKEADDIIDRFIDRNFSPNGNGGLFTVRNCEEDLRDVGIWTTMLWYLDSIM